VNKINNINLLVSTSKYNEINAEAELWFALLTIGDKYPIISKIEFPGLIIALSSINCKEIVKKFRDIIREDSKFFKFILKIVPIDFVCETNPKIIRQIVNEHYKTYIRENDTFKINLKRRKHEQIERNSFIEIIAKNITNKVNLNNPNKIIHIEILGKYTGVSFLTHDDILKLGTDHP